MAANHERVRALVLTLGSLLAASCGARTGLFEPTSDSTGGSTVIGGSGGTTAGSGGGSTGGIGGTAGTFPGGSGGSGGTPSCSPDGAPCATSSDCCSGICMNDVCSATACLPGEGPVELSAGHIWPFGIAEYGGYLFFTLYDGAGAVMRVPKTGGATTTIVDGLDYPSGIAVDATGVYVASSNDHQVFRTDTSGSSIEVLASGEYGPSDIALDDTHVYWANYVGDQIRRIPKEGGAAETLAGTSSSPYRLGLGPKLVYWGELADGLWSVPKAGGDVVARGEGEPRSFASDDSFVYFTNSNTGGIHRMPLGGGPIEILYETGGFSDGIAVDATHVYATFSEGEIVRMAKSGGDVELVAEGQAGPTHIVLDDGCAYWTNTGDGMSATGNVMRAPKTP